MKRCQKFEMMTLTDAPRSELTRGQWVKWINKFGWVTVQYTRDRLTHFTYSSGSLRDLLVHEKNPATAIETVMPRPAP